MTRSLSRAVPVAALAALALAVGACGDDTEQPAAAAGGKAPTVSVKDVDGIGAVLVDQDGAALYTPDEEADGTIHCTASCLSIWVPLAAPAGDPTAADGVEGKLDTIKRPDGSMQVTHDGKPLYSFTEDTQPGQVTGDGFKDTFDGQSFTWHAVTSKGTSSGTSGGGSRDYGY
jgi:predicted lipoprotein with Yx(FWY)xxD motif